LQKPTKVVYSAPRSIEGYLSNIPSHWVLIKQIGHSSLQTFELLFVGPPIQQSGNGRPWNQPRRLQTYSC